MTPYYLAITIAENERYYAYAMKVTENDNLYNKLAKIPNLKAANIFPTKKRASEVVARWNTIFILNQSYMFDI